MSSLQSLAIAAAYVLLALIALVIGKLVRQAFGARWLDRELTHNDNVAQGIAIVGYYAAVLVVFLGATYGEVLSEDPSDLFRMLGIDLLWTIGGIVAINLGRLTLDRLVLRNFCVEKEILEDRNAGTGATLAGAYLATGFVLAGAIVGEDGGIATALVSFLLSQLALIAFGILYAKTVGYDLHGEIERDNVAAGVAFGANLTALGIILFGVASEPLPLFEDGRVDWGLLASNAAILCAVSFLLLFVLRYAADKVLLPGASLKDEIVKDRNLNAAFVEGLVVIGMSSVIALML